MTEDPRDRVGKEDVSCEEFAGWGTQRQLGHLGKIRNFKELKPLLERASYDTLKFFLASLKNGSQIGPRKGFPGLVEAELERRTGKESFFKEWGKPILIGIILIIIGFFVDPLLSTITEAL